MWAAVTSPSLNRTFEVLKEVYLLRPEGLRPRLNRTFKVLRGGTVSVVVPENRSLNCTVEALR